VVGVAETGKRDNGAMPRIIDSKIIETIVLKRGKCPDGLLAIFFHKEDSSCI
jgi:hypothetical protein